jgi:hypothetical protein
MQLSWDLPKKLCAAALFLTLSSCSRTAVVVSPENGSLTEEPAVQTAVSRAQAEDAEPGRFLFPADAGGILLAKVLPPQDVQTTRRGQSPLPRRSTDSDFLKPPTLPLPPSYALLPHLPDDDTRALLRPRLVEEETLAVLPDAPPLPPAPALPDNGRIRVPSPDVNRPIPLPILARPVSDRVSLDDPTMDASTAAATAAPIPSRTRKAPFLKSTLPDPYDHRRTGVPAPEESKEFPLGSPQTPRR